jgi:hypothetical protein
LRDLLRHPSRRVSKKPRKERRKAEGTTKKKVRMKGQSEATDGLPAVSAALVNSPPIP